MIPYERTLMTLLQRATRLSLDAVTDLKKLGKTSDRDERLDCLQDALQAAQRVQALCVSMNALDDWYRPPISWELMERVEALVEGLDYFTAPERIDSIDQAVALDRAKAVDDGLRAVYGPARATIESRREKLLAEAPQDKVLSVRLSQATMAAVRELQEEKSRELGVRLSQAQLIQLLVTQEHTYEGIFSRA